MGTDRRATSFKQDISGLMESLGRSGIIIRDGAADLLIGLSSRIERWNKAVNLVSRKDIDRLVSYHFCDSASLLPIVRPMHDIWLLDIGGSNALPGLVLASISPHVKARICDSRRKRLAFLEEACQDLGDQASFELDRVDSEDFQHRHTAAFDLIVARAVTRLKHLFRWCMPLLKPGGYLAAYKGSRCLEEVRQAEPYLWSRGGGLITVMASPWAHECNPLRLFAIARRCVDERS
jgi:16S rRNA (guanine527-N7)-methyltransferase